MYNHKSIEKFIDKVNKEAEEAAKKVYDKYNNELLIRIQNQLLSDATVWIVDGPAIIENGYGEDVAEELGIVIGQTWHHRVNAGFMLPYKFNKQEIIKKDYP